MLIRCGPHLVEAPAPLINGLRVYMASLLEIMGPGCQARCTIFDVLGDKRNLCFEFRDASDPFPDALARIEVRSEPWPYNPRRSFTPPRRSRSSA